MGRNQRAAGDPNCARTGTSVEDHITRAPSVEVTC
jgi:hypothetical protein